MNRPPDEFKNIPVEQLRDFAAACLKTTGMIPEHAEQLAELLSNSDARGVRSHGTRALDRYCQRLRDKTFNPTPDIQIIEETDTSVLVDGDGGLGYAPMMLATEKAIQKAKQKKVAIGATRHHGHYGSAGHYVRRAMEEGCTAFSVQGTHPARFGEGGRNKGQSSAYWGNPPICFGFPSEEEPPLILDAATCIMADYQRGPEFDALQSMIPAAFFKSMGYTGSATALGGTFVGQSNERAREVEKKWPGAPSGGLIIVMDIAAFVPAEEFRSGIDFLVRGVRETMDPLPGNEEATLPGTIEHRNQQAYAAEGVPIGLEDLERLEKCGRESGVEPSWSE
ncbi:MAG: Ldh family oxidoreductase [Candidatus Latescibacterota bacterium]|jgi:L-2-hydroxycarboxylate dehydrogenase (NAD+)